MKLRQAVFVSAKIDDQDKICLAGRSEEIEASTIQQIVKWIPQRWELAQGHSEGFSFVQLSHDCFALSRSVPGIIDLRGRGEKQLVTSVLFVNREQLECLGGNAAILATIALTHGGLVLPIRIQKQLAFLELPDRTCLTPLMDDPILRAKERENISRAVDIHKQVAILGSKEPLDYIAGYVSMLDLDQRLNTCFAIGLDVSPSRPFQLLFYRGNDVSIQEELARQQVRTINLAPVVSECHASV